ncbi:hypothetical protein [Candidatus Pelagisphaera phototrophica]|nr:hypothetical protein [Candidatus Pelagisphaera phototrophica]
MKLDMVSFDDHEWGLSQRESINDDLSAIHTILKTAKNQKVAAVQ